MYCELVTEAPWSQADHQSHLELRPRSLFSRMLHHLCKRQLATAVSVTANAYGLPQGVIPPATSPNWLPEPKHLWHQGWTTLQELGSHDDRLWLQEVQACSLHEVSVLIKCIRFTFPKLQKFFDSVFIWSVPVLASSHFKRLRADARFFNTSSASWRQYLPFRKVSRKNVASITLVKEWRVCLLLILRGVVCEILGS